MAGTLAIVWFIPRGRFWHARLRDATDEQLGIAFVVALPVVVIFGGRAVLNNDGTLMLIAFLASYGVAAGYAIYAAARTPTSNATSRRRPWRCYPGRPQRYTPSWASFVALHALVLVAQGLILWWYRGLRPRLRDADAVGDAQVSVAIVLTFLAMGVIGLLLEWADDIDGAWWQKSAAVCGAIATHVGVPIGVFLYLW
jgi:hypothetical protein